MGEIPEHQRKPLDTPSTTTISSETEGQSETPHSAQKDEVVKEQISEQVILEVKNDAPVGRIHATCAREENLLLLMKSAHGAEPVTLTCEHHLPVCLITFTGRISLI